MFISCSNNRNRYRYRFLIYPWITHNIDKELKDGEAIVGSHVIGEKGETVHFFNEELKIVGRLKQTGIGFDATVFVNQNTAKNWLRLLKE